MLGQVENSKDSSQLKLLNLAKNVVPNKTHSVLELNQSNDSVENPFEFVLAFHRWNAAEDGPPFSCAEPCPRDVK